MLDLKHLEKAFESALIDLAIKLEQDSPVGATGQFKRSWDVDSTVNADGSVKGIIKNTDPKGRYKAIGRRAGKMPPIAPLREWVLAKGLGLGAVYPIAHAIARKGTQRYRSGKNVIGATRGNQIPPDKQREYHEFIIKRMTYYLRQGGSK